MVIKMVSIADLADRELLKEKLPELKKRLDNLIQELFITKMMIEEIQWSLISQEKSSQSLD
jgi:hypothetical protein